MGNWVATINLCDSWDKQLTPKQMAEAVVAAIDQVPEVLVMPGIKPIRSQFADFPESGTWVRFNNYMDKLWDWADLNRVWVRTVL